LLLLFFIFCIDFSDLFSLSFYCLVKQAKFIIIYYFYIFDIVKLAAGDVRLKAMLVNTN